jgi:aspartate dehydrogenase
MVTIGLLGCGNIGHIIAKYRENVQIIALYDKIFVRAKELEAQTCAVAYESCEDFLSQDFDLVVEAASIRAVRLYAADVLMHQKDLVIMSVGALSDPVFRTDLTETARSMKRKIYIPSGAVMGLDNLKVGRISPMHSLVLKTTKSPASLGIPADKRTLIFRGKANECIKEFPKNVNVSVALSLAAGADVDVELWADPEVDRNVHEIYAEGEFGDVYIRVRNVPSPDNPATSYLAALSILTLLRDIENPLVVGT